MPGPMRSDSMRSAIAATSGIGDVADGARAPRWPCTVRPPSRTRRTPRRRPPCRCPRRAAPPCGSSRRRAPAPACRARAGLVDVARDRGRADEADRVRCRDGRACASTATLSPWTTLNTPSGKPASAQSSASSIDADGSFSDGFRMNVLPHAIAFGHIQSGTMAGKLNGVMPAMTPSGWRTECTSTPVDAPARSSRP